MEQNNIDDEEIVSASARAGPDLQVLFREPFELYGGSFSVGESQKQKIVRDRVYRFYEDKVQTQA